MTKLSHLDDQGRARMVDVSEKEVTSRIAVAQGHVRMRAETLELILRGKVEKGDVFSVARVAGRSTICVRPSIAKCRSAKYGLSKKAAGKAERSFETNRAIGNRSFSLPWCLEPVSSVLS